MNSVLRRGAVGVMFLGMLVVMLAVTGMALHVAWLAQRRVQWQYACEAAALAGAAKLGWPTDPPEWMPPGQEKKLEALDPDAPAVEELVEAGRVEAMKFAALNGLKDSPRPELVFGWLENPTSLDSPFVPWQPGDPGPVNTLRVQVRWDSIQDNPISRWIGFATGIRHQEAMTMAQATFVQEIGGFRPRPGMPVPLVPLVAPVGKFEKPGKEKKWAEVVVEGGEQTDEEVEGEEGGGASGAVRSQAEPGNEEHKERTRVEVVDLTGVGDFAAALDQVRNGIQVGDLQSGEGEVSLGQVVPLLPTDKNRRQQLRQALTEIIGKERIWLLAQGGGGAQGAEYVVIVGFAAARLVDVRPAEHSNGNALQLTLEPCRLQTSTAVAGENAWSPWVGKVMVTK